MPYLGVLPVWERVTVMMAAAPAPECKDRVPAFQWLCKAPLALFYYHRSGL